MTRWFRYYDDALDDPKVQRLSGDLFKTWCNLLSLTSKNDGVLPSVDDISFRLRISVQDAQQRVEDLILAGLIDILPDGTHAPHNWSERQFASDSSAMRMQKLRKQKRSKSTCDVTGDVTVTVQKQTREDTDSESRAPAHAPVRGSGFKSLVDSCLGSRGVSPRLKERAEGLGLPVAELEQRATAPDVKAPNAMFRHLAVERLQRILPRADKRMLAAALTKDGGSAFGTVCQLIVERA